MKNVRLTPLIDGQEVFPALEEAVLNAKEACYLSFRLFDFQCRLRSKAAQKLGLKTWFDLVGHVLTKDIDFYLMIADFDLLGAPEEHACCAETMKQAGPFLNHPRFHILPALHPATPHRVLRYALWPWLWYELHKAWNKASAEERQLPGFQKHGGKNGISFWPPFRPSPATYHQKMAVCDPQGPEAKALIGGLDITERLYDDVMHQRPPEQTWHDVSVLLEACNGSSPYLLDKAFAHFCQGWNRQCRALRSVSYLRKRFHLHCSSRCPLPEPVAEIKAGAGRANFATLAPNLIERLKKPACNPLFLRTRSRQSRSVLSVGPEVWIEDFVRAHCEMIARTKEFLYIESQFLRDQDITDALIEAARANPALHVILLLPAIPEEIVFKKKYGLGMRYGEWLQINALKRIKDVLGDRLGVFCLAEPERTHEHHDKERYTVDKRRIIYVHAKVMISDHRTAIVSSANLNGRSMQWDEEAGVIWEDEETVQALQARLWSHHMLRPADAFLKQSPTNMLKQWLHLAEEKEPTSFIAPYPLDRACKFSRWFGLIPRNML
jgi:phosphatidylserine/phosphatidylglycerophosphate/cardiolipin synthase-like enzyme